MKVRTQRFHHMHPNGSIEDGEAHPDATQSDIRLAARRELRDSMTLTGIKISWIDEQGRHFCVEEGDVRPGIWSG